MTFYNRTRTSKSIPKKLFKQGKPYLIPLYYLLRTSKLGQEGIDNGGSYDFADHIYAGRPKGRFVVGSFIDWMLLRLPSVKSFRNRYVHAKEHLHRYVKELDVPEIHILAVPSGYARELWEVASMLQEAQHPNHSRLRIHLLDLDEQLLKGVEDHPHFDHHSYSLWSGNALESSSYEQIAKSHAVVSMGFTEFLTDQQVVEFFSLVYEHLQPGGILITSGMKRHKLSEYMLKNLADLHTQYRGDDELQELARRAGFSSIRTHQDSHGIQTMLIGKKI